MPVRTNSPDSVFPRCPSHPEFISLCLIVFLGSSLTADWPSLPHPGHRWKQPMLLGSPASLRLYRWKQPMLYCTRFARKFTVQSNSNPYCNFFLSTITTECLTVYWIYKYLLFFRPLNNVKMRFCNFYKQTKVGKKKLYSIVSAWSPQWTTVQTISIILYIKLFLFWEITKSRFFTFLGGLKYGSNKKYKKLLYHVLIP